MPATAITSSQLRRLLSLWREWTRPLRLGREQDRALRHYYVELFSGGRARATKDLSREEAQRVIAALARQVRAAESRVHWAAGTAGRQGFPEWRRLPPSASAWRSLWGTARALGMSREQLNAFIRARYAKFGLSGTGDLRTMANLNRVLWGLKAMLRRRNANLTRTRQASNRAA